MNRFISQPNLSGLGAHSDKNNRWTIGSQSNAMHRVFAT